MNEWVVQLRKGLLELCVLNVLRRGESYGYRIVQDLKQIEELAVTESTVYPILNRLRRDNYLRVRAVPSNEGPPRRYYALTAPGRRRAAEMYDYWRSLVEAVERLKAVNEGTTGHENR